MFTALLQVTHMHMENTVRRSRKDINVCFYDGSSFIKTCSSSWNCRQMWTPRSGCELSHIYFKFEPVWMFYVNEWILFCKGEVYTRLTSISLVSKLNSLLFVSLYVSCWSVSGRVVLISFLCQHFMSSFALVICVCTQSTHSVGWHGRLASPQNGNL